MALQKVEDHLFQALGFTESPVEAFAAEALMQSPSPGTLKATSYPKRSTLFSIGLETKFQVLSGIRTHDLCDTGAVLSQLSYQSHMRAVVYGLALYTGTFRLGPSTVNLTVICPIVAIE